MLIFFNETATLSGRESFGKYRNKRTTITIIAPSPTRQAVIMYV